MRTALLAAAAAIAAACASPRASVDSGASARADARRAAPAAPEAARPNLILVVSESVPNPEDDGVSLTKVFVDGKEIGQTAVARKAEEHVLKLRLPPGNQPVRLEHWVLPGVGEWTRLDDQYQPRERFVRVEDETVVRLELRFAEGEGSNVLTLSREPAPAAR